MCSIPASVTPVSVWCSDDAVSVSVWCVADVDSHSSVARCVSVSLLVIPNVYMNITLMSPTLKQWALSHHNTCSTENLT